MTTGESSTGLEICLGVAILVDLNCMMIKHIVRDPAVAEGKATIQGTDITVNTLLKELSAGVSVGEIREKYPQLTEGLILEAIAYAADVIEKTESDSEIQQWSREFINEYRPALEALATQ